MNKVGLVILDGVGYNADEYGNAVKLAKMKNYNKIIQSNSVLIKTHGTAVGFPSDDIKGNSEVGHNAIGAGRVIKQGLSLINDAFSNNSIFNSEVWKKLIANGKKNAIHFVGLLSDGKVHGDINHLKQLLTECKKEKVKKVFVHALLDGRDVGPQTADKYLKDIITFLKNTDENYKLASIGGRNKIVMDRYESNISWVQRAYDVYVNLNAPIITDAILKVKEIYKENPKITDQEIEPYILDKTGKINNGDSVLLYNYRGDRALEFSRLFDEFKYVAEAKVTLNKCYYAGMLEYDGDLKTPKNYLVEAPVINKTLTEFLIKNKIYQYSISETQKFGHITYNFNGNREQKFSDKYETYEKVISDKNITFDLKPKMKAKEIGDKFCNAIKSNKYEFLKINFTNGDMVAHTGNLKATIKGLQAVDRALGKIIKTAQKNNTVLFVTADHGNSETMLDEKGNIVSSHTINPVYFSVINTKDTNFKVNKKEQYSLTNIASSVCKALELTPPNYFNEPII